METKWWKLAVASHCIYINNQTVYNELQGPILYLFNCFTKVYLIYNIILASGIKYDY